MKCLGMDLGTRTLGLATSDKLGMIASPYKTIRYDDINTLVDEVVKIIDELHIEALVLGYPKNMNGSVGERAQICEAMAAELKELFPDLKDVVLWDERLSTVAATRVMVDADISRKKRKKVVDMMAAVVILQNYLDSKQFKARL